MRLHIFLDDDLVGELDRRIGARRRSAFIAQAVRVALDEETRWELIDGSIGAIEDAGHEWDADPAAWVRRQRASDARRTG